MYPEQLLHAGAMAACRGVPRHADGTAIARGQSFLVGAVALLTLLTAHAGVTLGRGNRLSAKAADHRVRVLVDHGVLRPDQLRICG